jgi:cobalt-zinc-cadmium efflux system membrane fusion protein
MPNAPGWSGKSRMIKLRKIQLSHELLVQLGLLLFMGGCGQPDQKSTPPPVNHQRDESPVRYVKVTERAIPETLDLAAKVQADPTKVVRIFPPASGRVVAIKVKPGERVRRGQSIATLSSSDVASAQSDFAKANIEAERTTRVVDRQKILFEHGAAAEKDYIDSRAQADAARAELARARQRLQLLSVSPSAVTDQVALVTPASGVVLDVGAAPGEFSKSLESANPLVTIADLSTVWIVGDVYEKDVSKIARGTPLRITLQAYPGKEWNSHVDSISGTLDPTTRTLKIRSVLPNRDQRLKPEMFGTIHVKAGTHQALVVPQAAIIREGSTATVFVRVAGKPEQRTVTVGETVDGSVEVLTGLKAGDEVAAEGAELLKGGPTE